MSIWSAAILNDAIQAGVRAGYEEGFLRKSMCHPLTRKEYGWNDIPAVISSTTIVPGDKVGLR